jgi:hypothetical protein
VFASSDKSEEEFTGYHAKQPWLAIPFANRDAKVRDKTERHGDRELERQRETERERRLQSI